MRQLQILLAVMVLISGCGIALAADTPALTATIGFGGYYRPHTLVPIAVSINNAGDTLHGEFRVTSQTERVFAGRYTSPVTIPRGANQLQYLYITPQVFAKDITVEFWSHGEKLASAPITSCQELYETGRLVVVAGGAGTAFNSVNGTTIHPSRATANPRPWDYSGETQNRYLAYSGQNGRPTGILSVAYVDRTHLPDNPEAYGSVAVLALMSDTTENNLSAGAQDAIAQWVASGGHLLLAGGGITSRLQAPFFTKLLPRHGQPAADALSMTNTSGGQAITGHIGAGYVTTLSYDPETTSAGASTAFYQSLFTQEPSTPASVLLHPNIYSAIMVRNLQPPNLSLIIVYLLIYLVTLVPVNYFVLKKMDKREMAWITTPIIVFFFTLGAYGIGYATKGHRLVLNQISVVETSAGQSAAEAVSELLIFSPSRTSYDLDLGENGLFAQEIIRNDDNSNNYNGPSYQQQPVSSDVSFVDNDGKLELDDIGVNMWDFRQFAMVHHLDLRGGFSAHLTAGAAGAAPRATGTVTNNTPFRFAHCELYVDGALASTFTMDPQQRVTVEKTTARQVPVLSEDEKNMYDKLQTQAASQLCSKEGTTKGFLLLAYTTDPLCQAKLSGHSATTNLGVFVVHLP